ncbi:unnamed protein product [Clonostachys byssicola]|uniref:N-acetyltransferase domain-containing protein n=1 Tax=Clonostachys byssicola TaxID=160290 RepID=A0A9N9XX81_9HYPO|nr:unnamed protein product [Clonostachys byssicola]
MAPYEISPNCTVADAKGIASCNVSAYWKETWWRLLWPEKTPESLVEAIAARTPRNLLQMRGLRRHQKVKDVASGEIVGYARWVLPDSHDDKWLEAQTPDVDEAAKAKFKSEFEEADYEPRDDMDEMDDHMWEWRSKYDRDDCLELEYLAVHADHSRKGVGSMLVQSGVEVASKLGLDIIVIAMGKNAFELFSKAGFELLEKEIQDLSTYGEQDVYETYYLIKRPTKDTEGSK